MHPQTNTYNHENLKALLENNDEHIKQYKNSPIMQLIHHKIMTEKSGRMRLLDCLQIFSDYFQKVVMLRTIFCDDKKFLHVANEHLSEEFGHNMHLSKDRAGRPPLWDPILESTGCWFSWKMLTRDNDEKTVLVHFVLESSANIFFQAANKALSQYQETDYFKMHAEADEHHEKMGINLLKEISDTQLKKLLTIQNQGWDILNIACDRIAKITLELTNEDNSY